MAEKLGVALLSVVIGIGALAGAAWLIVVGEIAGVERIFVILVAVILVLVAGLWVRLEFRAPEKRSAAPAARPATAPPNTQNSATDSRVPAST